MIAGCPDCAKVVHDVPPIRRMCDYHALVTGNGSADMRQAMAATIDPDAFTKAADSHRYFALAMPDKKTKFSAYEARAVQAAFEAADRVAVLVGWTW